MPTRWSATTLVMSEICSRPKAPSSYHTSCVGVVFASASLSPVVECSRRPLASATLEFRAGLRPILLGVPPHVMKQTTWVRSDKSAPRSKKRVCFVRVVLPTPADEARARVSSPTPAEDACFVCVLLDARR